MIRWFIIAVLFLVGLSIIIGNAWIFWKSNIKKEHSPSVAPLLGGILCAVAILIIPENKHLWLAIIPLILDLEL